MAGRDRRRRGAAALLLLPRENHRRCHQDHLLPQAGGCCTGRRRHPAIGGDFSYIPMDQIEPDPDQPRQVFEPVALRELAASIRADGLLQPIAIRPSTTGRTPYMIAVGERRWRAHQINGARTIRAIVVAPKSTTDLRVMQIIENDQRSDVTPLEQARSYHSLMGNNRLDGRGTRRPDRQGTAPHHRAHGPAEFPLPVPSPAGQRQPETLRGHPTGAPVAPRAGHAVQRHPHRGLPELQRPPGVIHRACRCRAAASADARRTAADDQRGPGPRQRLRGACRTGCSLLAPASTRTRSSLCARPTRTGPAPWPTCWPSCRPTCAGSRSRSARLPSRRVSSPQRDPGKGHPQ